MESRASHLLVGSFVLTLIAALFIFVLWAAKIQLEETQTPYHIYFSGSVTGLQVGSPVRYAGVPVGTVTDIRIDPVNVERVRVTVELRNDVQIKTDAVASLEMQGITGGVYVQIAGGTQQSQPLASRNGEIPVIPSRPSTIREVVDVAPQVLNRALELSERLAGFLTAENQRSVNEILFNIQLLTQELAGASRTLSGTLGEVSETANHVKGLVADTRTITERLAGNADALLAQARRTLTNVEGDTKTLGTELTHAARDTRDLARSLKGAADQIGEMVKETRKPVRAFADGGLYDFTQLIAEMRGLTASLARVAGQLERDPSEFLFGSGRGGERIRR